MKQQTCLSLTLKQLAAPLLALEPDASKDGPGEVFYPMAWYYYNNNTKMAHGFRCMSIYLPSCCLLSIQSKEQPWK